MDKHQLAQEVFKVSHITGHFLLRSGRTSTEYFDKYQFSSRPHLLAAISQEMLKLLPQDFDFLGAMEMGGIPLATALSLQTGKPIVFIRKEAKEYGTCKFAEGADIKNKKICIIEDVITTGGQVVISTEMLRKEGAIIENVLCVIDRSEGKIEDLTQAGLHLKSVFTMSELKSS